jgi:hypothetical protein
MVKFISFPGRFSASFRLGRRNVDRVGRAMQATTENFQQTRRLFF